MASASCDVFDVMLRRRSTRKFEADKAVPREQLERIVQCAQRAPTGRNAQELRFWVLAGRVVEDIGEATEALALPKFPHLEERKATHGVTNVITYGATAAVAITAPRELPETITALDTGFAAQNILLAAEALGLGAIPVGIAGFVNEAGVLRRIGADPEKERLMLLVPIGVPSPLYISQGLRPSKEITSQVHWVDT